MRKISFFVAIIMLLALVFTGCSQPAEADPNSTAVDSTDSTAPDASAETSPESSQEATGEIKDMQFYGKIVEYTGGPEACDKMQELLVNKYNIESLQVDWANLEKVIRTGIASGQPCDVYEYWTQNIRTFAEKGMALDLTPYLDADDGAWRKTLSGAGLASGYVDGKNYAIPITSNYSLMLANNDLLKENGIEIPENWNWDQFMSFCEQCATAGIFPVGQNADNRQGDWFMRNGLLSMSTSQDKEILMHSAEIPCTDEIFTTVLTNIKDMYDSNYVYPGEGAVTITRDEVKAAFYQGKVALMNDVAAAAAATAGEAPFEVVVVPWPSMGEKNAVLGGCDALFVPSNVKDPDAAVELVKTYTSAEVQSFLAEGGVPVANIEVVPSNEITKKAIEYSCFVYPFEFISFSEKLNEYSFNTSLSDLVLNGGVETVQNAMEALRQEAKVE